MRLNEISKSQDFHTFTKQLASACSDYVAEMKNMKSPNGFQDSLIRGLLDTGSDRFGELPIRTDRKPLDTPLFVSRIYNFIAEKQIGIANLREKVIFTTGVFENAMGFGVPCFIFPMNGTSYFYESTVTDSIFTTKRIQQMISKIANRPGWKGLYGGYDISEIVNRLSRAPSSTQQKFIQDVYAAAPRLVQLYKMGGVQALPKHIAAGEEIMLYGASDYYFVNCLYLQNYLNAKTTQEAISVYAQILDSGEWITLDSDEEDESS